eukprot:scaffold293771_cov39-Tisochrysis_lutea.AAC.3
MEQPPGDGATRHSPIPRVHMKEQLTEDMYVSCSLDAWCLFGVCTRRPANSWRVANPWQQALRGPA